METTTLIGVSGAAIILIAFVLSQVHLWGSNWLIYEFCNFIGSALLVWYAVLLGSVPFIILNGVWGVVSLWYVYVDLIRNSHRKHHTILLHRRSFFQKWME